MSRDQTKLIQLWGRDTVSGGREAPGSPQSQEILLACKELGHGVRTAVGQFVVEKTGTFRERRDMEMR